MSTTLPELPPILPPAPKPPLLLHHYTTRPGLLGIVRDRRLWATEIRYLNDAREFRYTIDLVCEAIDRELKSTTDPSTRRCLSNMKSWAGYPSPHMPIFVFCLSARVDSLSQWRAYGNRDGSYAIAFNGPRLKALCKRSGLALRPCVYSQRAQQRLVTDALRAGKRHYQEAVELGGWSVVAQNLAGLGFAVHLQVLGQIMKHPSFKDEREWRIVSETGGSRAGRKFRQTPILLTPFTEIPLGESGDDDGIREVMVGPSPHLILELMAVSALLEDTNHSDAKATISAVPYRHW